MADLLGGLSAHSGGLIYQPQNEKYLIQFE